MTVRDILKVTEIGEMQAIWLYSMDGMTEYGIQNSVYSIPEKYLGYEVKKITTGYGHITLKIDVEG